MSKDRVWIIILVVIGALLLYSDFKIDLPKVGQTLIAIAIGWYALTHKN